MEVMVEVSSIPAFVSGTAQDKRRREEEQEDGCGGVVVGLFSGQSGGEGFLSGSGKGSVGSEEPEASLGSSSLGDPSDDENQEEEDVVSSHGGGDNDVVSAGDGFGSLSSLEDSLPIKRGLSNCFTGRSKSFANLSDVNRLQDLQKEENPFNKRRRTLIAYKLSRKKSSFYSWQNPNSMPLLALKALKEEEEVNQENNNSSEEDEEEERKEQKLHERKLRTFKSTSCFSLADL